MAGKFVRASSQYLINSAPALPSTGYPLTIGAWFTQDAIAAIEAIVTYSNSAAGKFGIMTLQVSATGQITAGNAPDAGGTNGATTTGTISTGTWNFAVARLITATNRKLAALFSTGVSEHASNVTGTAPTGLNNITIGCRNVNASPANFHGGMIGEVWYTNTDIQADGLALQDETLRQLAYGGPFSLPHIAKDIIEYRSLRKHPSSDGDDPNEIFSNAGPQTWVNTNGATIGEHPPLPYWFVRPGQTMRNLII